MRLASLTKRSEENCCTPKYLHSGVQAGHLIARWNSLPAVTVDTPWRSRLLPGGITPPVDRDSSPIRSPPHQRTFSGIVIGLVRDLAGVGRICAELTLLLARLSIHADTSPSIQPTVPGLSRRDTGKSPARCNRQIDVRESPVLASTSRRRSIWGDLATGVACCGHPFGPATSGAFGPVRS